MKTVSSVVSEYAHSPTEIASKGSILQALRKVMDVIIGKMVPGVKVAIQTMSAMVLRLFLYLLISGCMKELWRTTGS